MLQGDGKNRLTKINKKCALNDSIIIIVSLNIRIQGDSVVKRLFKRLTTKM